MKLRAIFLDTNPPVPSARGGGAVRRPRAVQPNCYLARAERPAGRSARPFFFKLQKKKTVEICSCKSCHERTGNPLMTSGSAPAVPGRARVR
jgi:hypothetical protein